MIKPAAYVTNDLGRADKDNTISALCSEKGNNHLRAWPTDCITSHSFIQTGKIRLTLYWLNESSACYQLVQSHFDAASRNDLIEGGGWVSLSG